MQLFTHLLSSYLQGMGDFFSALPKRRELLLAVFDVVRGAPSPWEGTEKLKPTIKLKVDDGETAVLPFIICLF